MQTNQEKILTYLLSSFGLKWFDFIMMENGREAYACVESNSIKL